MASTGEDESDDALIKKYRKEAEERRKRDIINTNILNSDDPTLQIAQDVILGYAVGQAVDAVTVDLLKDSLVRAIQKSRAVKVPFKGAGKSIKFGPKAIQKCIKAVQTRIKSLGYQAVQKLNQAPGVLKKLITQAKLAKTAVINAAKRVAAEVAEKGFIKATQRAAQRIAARAAAIAAKIAAKVAAKTAATATKIATRQAAMAGACAVTGPGCAAVIALEVILLAFDAINIALDIIDEQGFSVVLYKPDIKAVAESTKEWMNNNYNTSEDPKYMSEEIFFDWESFLYDIDENDNIIANEEWGTKYEKYRDDYMRHIGITGDWRSRLETEDVADSKDPGVLTPLTVQMLEITKPFRKKTPPRSDNTKIIIISILIVVFIVIIIILVTSKGDDGAEGSESNTNNQGIE